MRWESLTIWRGYRPRINHKSAQGQGAARVLGAVERGIFEDALGSMSPRR